MPNLSIPAKCPRTLKAAAILAAAAALAALRRETGVRTVVVHPGDFGAAVRTACRRVRAARI